MCILLNSDVLHLQLVQVNNSFKVPKERDGWQNGDSDCIKSCFYEILSPLCKYARHVVIIHPIAIAIAAESLISRSAISRSVGDQVLIFIRGLPVSQQGTELNQGHELN